jgi:hypothetical protein
MQGNVLMTFLQYPPHAPDIVIKHGVTVQQEDSVSCGAFVVYNMVRLGLCKEEFTEAEFTKQTKFDADLVDKASMEKVRGKLALCAVLWCNWPCSCLPTGAGGNEKGCTDFILR